MPGREILSTPRAVLVVIRAALLGLCLAFAVIQGDLAATALPLLALGAIAVLASLAASRQASPMMPLVEATLAATVIGLTAAGASAIALFPYLLAPAVEAGLMWGVGSVLATVSVEAIGLTVVALAGGSQPDRAFASTLAQWVFLAAAAGMVAAWARHLIAAATPSVTASYAAAYRLLSQLRAVSRQLSGGLDAYSLAQALLQTLRSELHYTRAAIFVRSEGGRLVPLAHGGVGPVDWVPSLEDDSPWAEAWTSGLPQRQSRTFSSGPGGYAAVIPMRVGVRVVGLVGLERLEAPFTQEQLREATDVVDEAALRIDTALLFSDVRQIATAEERRRVAREIHDGIAQELASIGYVIDDMAYRAKDEAERESLQYLRGEITRVISELRLSIFDLRSDVDATTGLGAALSDYVRTVGATSSLTVHLMLDEAPQRLRTEAEAELLRVAQEAITNVRRHARASNLWVVCRTAPPTALLRIEDDGLGLGTGRTDSYGMDIMRERTARLGAELSVRPRTGGGTVVEVLLGRSDAAERRPVRSEGGAHVHDGAAR